MSYVPGFKTRLLVGDFHLAAYARQITFPWTADMLDATVFTTGGAKAFLPGQDTSTVSVEGLYDAAEHADLTAWKAGAAQAVTIAPSGLALGSELWMVNAVETELVSTNPIGDIAAFSLAAQTDGLSDFGVSLADLAAVTADTNGTAVDGGAASSNGGVGHLHVTAFSGFSGAAVTIEDSANGSSGWATILTFTTAAGVTGERVAITGAVRRYLRAVFDVTGTGSVTAQVSFARR